VNPLSILSRFLGGQARNRRNYAIYFALASSVFRVARRIMNPRQRMLLRFEVKPGETYELRGVRRGR
jgi:hypothetical protein